MPSLSITHTPDLQDLLEKKKKIVKHLNNFYIVLHVQIIKFWRNCVKYNILLITVDARRKWRLGALTPMWSKILVLLSLSQKQKGIDK